MSETKARRTLPKPSKALAATYRTARPAVAPLDLPTLSGLPPQIVAHRGASHHEPEHTVEAYERAIDVGADALECDVRLTADGHLVCVHDRTAQRTSNGRGVISNLELAQLEGLDWGSWKARMESLEGGGAPSSSESSGSPASSNIDGAVDGGAAVSAGSVDSPLGRRALDDDDDDDDREVAVRSGSQLLTFRQLLRTTLDAGRRVDLAVETKHPSKHTWRVEAELARVLREFGLDAPDESRTNVRVMSFSLPAVSRMTTLTPQVPLAWLMEGVVPQRLRGGQLPPGISIAAMSIGMLRRNPGIVAEQHARGHEVHVWTVDAREDIERCLRNGVDAIITNKPKKALKARAAFYG